MTTEYALVMLATDNDTEITGERFLLHFTDQEHITKISTDLDDITGLLDWFIAGNPATAALLEIRTRQLTDWTRHDR